MKLLTEGLRWKLILGCLVIAVLEGPQAGLLLVQDLSGPYRTESSAGPRSTQAAAAAEATAAAAVAPGHLVAVLPRPFPWRLSFPESALAAERSPESIDVPDESARTR